MFDEYFPVSHDKHRLDEVMPNTPEYEPTGHEMQAVLSTVLYCPTVQLEQLADPGTDDTVPTGQFWQALSRFCPMDMEYFPMAHKTQALLELAPIVVEYEPALQ